MKRKVHVVVDLENMGEVTVRFFVIGERNGSESVVVIN